jgi:very-short-patch-repair endonuclease
MRSTPKFREIRALAADQHDVVSRSQLIALEMSQSQIDNWITGGWLDQVHRSVYKMGGADLTFARRAKAAELAAGPGAVISHRAACVLWRIDTPGLRWGAEPAMELTVPSRRHPKLRGVILHRSLDLVPEQCGVVEGIGVTNPLRLLVDLGAVTSDFHVERALDQLNERGLVTIREVAALNDELRGRGRRGCGVLAQVLERRGLGADDTHSRLESVFAGICRDHVLPPPEYQYPIRLDKQRYIDFAYPALKIAIEVDGYEFHSSRDAFQDDRARSNLLMARGWAMLRFTWEDCIHRPAWVADTVRATRQVRVARASQIRSA